MCGLPPALRRPRTVITRRGAAQVLLLMLHAGAAPAQPPAEELAALKDEVARLSARIAELEERLAGTLRKSDVAATMTTEAPDDRQPPATANPPLSRREPQISLGGRIKMDAIYNTRSAGSGRVEDVRLNPGTIPLSGQGERDQIDFSARASRLWLKGWLPTDRGDIGAYLEFDLFGDGGNQRITNGYGVRVRHAYAQFGGLLFGQTYSTFVNVTALPELNDDGIGAGVLLVRQPLVRFSREFAGGRASVALENPESTLRSDSGERITPDDERLPDMVVRYDRTGSWGDASIAVLAREIRLDDAGTDDAALGGAVSAAGTLNLGVDDLLRFNIVGGNAIGRYASSNAFDSGRLGAGGDIGLTWSTGGYLSWQHFWSAEWRTNLTAGYAWQDDSAAIDQENVEIYTLHANLLWSPVASTTLGLEWIHAHRRRFDGQPGRLDRLQFSAIHKF